MVKRATDVVVGGLGLVATAPVQALVAGLIVLEDGRPVIFRQLRAGRLGRPVELRKFRSMRVNEASPLELGQIDPSHPLVTRVGRVIRRLKIDELPQLLHVVGGDLSLVGPRPALLEHAAGYGEFERRRLSMRPGLTGWAQVNGNTQLSWEERILLDVWYVEHWSLGLDLRILLRTVAVITCGDRQNRQALEEAIAHANRAHRRSGEQPGRAEGAG